MKKKKSNRIDTTSMKVVDGGWVDKKGNFISEDEAIMDDMLDQMDNEDVHCYECKHLNEDEDTCEAFPEGIPLPIFIGEVRHDEPYNGDSGIRFEKKA